MEHEIHAFAAAPKGLSNLENVLSILQCLAVKSDNTDNLVTYTAIQCKMRMPDWQQKGVLVTYDVASYEKEYPRVTVGYWRLLSISGYTTARPNSSLIFTESSSKKNTGWT
jgi:hypothetical protein